MSSSSKQGYISEIMYREARRQDLSAIVSLLADDPLGSQREDASQPLNERYQTAFEAINSDHNNMLYVAAHDERVIGVLQLTFIPYLTYRGSWRALIEGVRIHRDYRSAGVGRQFFQWAIEQSRNRGCHLVQLTSDKARPEAIRFYESLGFTPSHEGLKLTLA
ncbi:GNAT family N-acetyltransferase [Halomonas shantousis]